MMYPVTFTLPISSGGFASWVEKNAKPTDLPTQLGWYAVQKARVYGRDPARPDKVIIEGAYTTQDTEARLQPLIEFNMTWLGADPKGNDRIEVNAGCAGSQIVVSHYYKLLAKIRKTWPEYTQEIEKHFDTFGAKRDTEQSAADVPTSWRDTLWENVAGVLDGQTVGLYLPFDVLRKAVMSVPDTQVKAELKTDTGGVARFTLSCGETATADLILTSLENYTAMGLTISNGIDYNLTTQGTMAQDTSRANAVIRFVGAAIRQAFAYHEQEQPTNAAPDAPSAPTSGAGGGQGTLMRKVLVRLHKQIEDSFGDEELRTLCFDIGEDYESLPAQGKAGKARELVACLDRRGRIPDLIAKCSELRPNVSWEDKPE